MPKIRCQRCGKEQQYHGQADCEHCKVRLNNWSVASQLRIQTLQEEDRREVNNDHEDDGS